MPEIQKEIKTLVKNEMRATKSSISNEIDTKIDTYDKFNQLKAAAQEAKLTRDRRELTRKVDRILAENPININSRVNTLNALRTNPYKRKEFIDASI